MICALFLSMACAPVWAKVHVPGGADVSHEPDHGQVLHITTFDYASPVIDGLAQAMSEIYASLGVRMELVRMPGKRALLQASDGASDGELMRIALDEDAYPDLIRIPVPLTEIRVRAFGLDPALEQVDSWEALAPYRVGALRGMVLVEQNLGSRAIYTNRFASLAGMLTFGRVDAVVVPDVALQSALKMLKLTHIDFYQSKVLGRFRLYHYLHRRHAKLAERLTMRLQEEMASGRWAARLEPHGLEAPEGWASDPDKLAISARESDPGPSALTK